MCPSLPPTRPTQPHSAAKRADPPSPGRGWRQHRICGTRRRRFPRPSARWQGWSTVSCVQRTGCGRWCWCRSASWRRCGRVRRRCKSGTPHLRMPIATIFSRQGLARSRRRRPPWSAAVRGGQPIRATTDAAFPRSPPAAGSGRAEQESGDPGPPPQPPSPPCTPAAPDCRVGSRTDRRPRTCASWFRMGGSATPSSRPIPTETAPGRQPARRGPPP